MGQADIGPEAAENSVRVGLVVLDAPGGAKWRSGWGKVGAGREIGAADGARVPLTPSARVEGPLTPPAPAAATATTTATATATATAERMAHWCPYAGPMPHPLRNFRRPTA
ncbi:hypothetical protein [Antrihabitans spumae]|uniref:Uncharacterized protein n=1 Tax=Antrihabitans spumae TaxID=3373370 RepID=A0ABW7K516_9NOCA